MDPDTLLGEARSKCEHLAGAPIQPEVAQNLSRVALVKGVRATTAIEGNTLTEDQVAGILDGTFRAPPSREYQEHEVRNVLTALTEIDKQIMNGERPAITTELICDFNLKILTNTDHEESAVAGDDTQPLGRRTRLPWRTCRRLRVPGTPSSRLAGGRHLPIR